MSQKNITISENNNESKDKKSHKKSDQYKTNTELNTKSNSWSDLIARYKNLWRGRLMSRDTYVETSLFLSVILGSGIVTTLALYPNINLILLMTPIALILTNVVTAVYFGLKNRTDSFISSQIGIVVGSVLSLVMFSQAIMTGSSILVFGIVLLFSILYTTGMSLASAGYWFVGNIIAENDIF